MEMTDAIKLIKESFELWYNKYFAAEIPVSIAINYSDSQTLAIKAYHKACLEVQAIGIEGNKSFVYPIIKVEENYNHGVTSEQEAKDNMIKKLLMELYGYKK